MQLFLIGISWSAADKLQFIAFSPFGEGNVKAVRICLHKFSKKILKLLK